MQQKYVQRKDTFAEWQTEVEELVEAMKVAGYSQKEMHICMMEWFDKKRVHDAVRRWRLPTSEHI